MAEQALTLQQLNRRIASLVNVPQVQNVWVTAELSDVKVSHGHCYMELLQKDDSGAQVAKARAVIWANVYATIAPHFYRVTGTQLASGIEVMLRVSVSMHPVFGMSLVVSAINPEYTMGDLMRRRRETLLRLKEEGVIDLNRELPWPEPTWRVAVVSAAGAAGYGDFRRHLYENPRHLRFHAQLFPAIMQGEQAPASIIAALCQIGEVADEWDCVVIIRGGGATSDLQAFEDYELAHFVATFPLPVISGVGHERDTTVLDFVAAARAKTPTAAADLIIEMGTRCLEEVRRLASDILHAATEVLGAEREHLSYIEGVLPVAPLNALNAANRRLGNSLLTLSNVSARRITPALERLNVFAESLPAMTRQALQRQADQLDGRARLLEVVSPQSVLARGYSITRDADGHALTDATALAPGQQITTTFASGTVTSTVN